MQRGRLLQTKTNNRKTKIAPGGRIAAKYEFVFFENTNFCYTYVINNKRKNIEMDDTPVTQNSFEPNKQQFKSKKSIKLPILIALGVLILVGLVGGGEYYLLERQKQDAKTSSDKQIAELNNQISKLKSGAASTTNSNSDMTDADYLNYLTIKKFNTTEDAKLYYAAPVISRSNAEWAVTIPYLAEKQGVESPARGLSQYLWRKTNGVWTFVAFGGDIGDSWDDTVRSLAPQIPEEIIPHCALVQC